MIIRGLLFVSIFIFSMPVNAAYLYCEGKVENSYIHSDGDVNIKGKWRGSWTKICNTNDADTVTCSLWTSYVAAAVKNNLTVTVHYVVADNSGLT